MSERVFNVNKLAPFLIIIAICLSFSSCGTQEDKVSENKNGLAEKTGNIKEEYHMVTFISGIEFWKGCYRGFEDAAKNYGVKTFFDGCPEYDIAKQATVLEQVISKKPTGIAVTCINPDALEAPIKKAINQGIPVVTFDSDSPNSGRYSFLGTKNYEGGVIAARHFGKVLHGVGELGLVTVPGLNSEEQRALGFKETISKEYPNIKLVQIVNGNAESEKSAQGTAAMIQAHSGIEGIFATDSNMGMGVLVAVKEAKKKGIIKIVAFDTDKAVLDAVKSGEIDILIAQGSWNMGYWSLQFLYQLHHNLVNPAKDWKQKGLNPLPPFVDTGITVIDKHNVDAFYTN